MNKKPLIVLLIILVAFLLIFGCININYDEDTLLDNNLSADDSNSLVEEKNNGNIFSNLDEFKRVKVGDNVSVHYIGTLINGEKFDSSYDRGATLDFIAGVGQMIKGFDDAIIGMRVGEKKTIQIPPKEAYGELNEEVEYVDRSMFIEDEEIEVGMIFYSGQIQAEIVSVDGDVIGLIQNHSLAGQTLIFEIELVKIN